MSTALLGRRTERAAIDQLLAAARSGRSGALVLRGQAGIGKTALLDDAAGSGASSFSVVWCVGVESEAQFAFAGLHQLCAPLLALADDLPDEQRDGLEVAFGVRGGPPPDMFLLGLATLNLLASAARTRPLLCLVDDAQWLDQASAQVLAFVARRLGDEGIAMLLARRDAAPGETDSFSGLNPSLRIGGLDEHDARALLARRLVAPVDPRVRDRIVAEARGNPLALLELPVGALLSEWAGGFESPSVLSIPNRIEHGFVRRSAGLSAQAQQLLLVAAADATGDAALLWRAADQLGIDREAAVSVEDTGLIEFDTRVRFRHPLVRSAVYQAASPGERRRAHRALAAVTDPATDPDRRAWHLAQGVVGADEAVAAELESSAERTRARGGVAAAAAFLQRATELTPAPAPRARRALAAAHAKHDAGASGAAGELLDVAASGPLDDLQRARVDLLRARIAFQLTQGDDVPGMLLAAASALAPLDAALARQTYLHALDATMIIGGARTGRRAVDVATIARAAPVAPGRPTPPDLLLDGLVTTFTEGYVQGAPAVREALEAFRDHGFDGEAMGEMGSRRWMGLATRTAAAYFDNERGHVLADRTVRLAREAGALATLPLSLVALSANLVLTGDIARAEKLAAEAAAITRATGAVPLPYADLYIASWRGRRDDTLRLTAAGIEGASETGAGAAAAQYALAVLYNGAGEYALARDAALRATDTDEFVNSSMALPELVEAAVRAADPGCATDAVDELTARATASCTPWARGLAARSRALISPPDTAEEQYLEAVMFLQQSDMVGHLARTHLVYGEWLRRAGRRHDARTQLRTAHGMLTAMGAEGFAARAAREWRATGERPRTAASDALTDRESEIATLAAGGATSREIGAQLFLSPRTVDAHLRSIFRKLGITSRRQLSARGPS